MASTTAWFCNNLKDVPMDIEVFLFRTTKEMPLPINPMKAAEAWTIRLNACEEWLFSSSVSANRVDVLGKVSV